MIHIDLRKLTPAHFAEAEATPKGGCMYTDPCIIGTLMDEADRDRLGGSIGQLMTEGIVSCPKDQEEDITQLQYWFDCRSVCPDFYRETKEQLCQKYNI